RGRPRIARGRSPVEAAADGPGAEAETAGPTRPVALRRARRACGLTSTDDVPTISDMNVTLPKIAEPTAVAGVKWIPLKSFSDPRGWLIELFRNDLIDPA